MLPMSKQLLVLLFLSTAASLVHSYTAEDSFTWAIKSNVLGSDYHQDVYDRFMEECRQDAKKRGSGDDCDKDEKHRLYMNSMQPAAVREICPCAGDGWNLFDANNWFLFSFVRSLTTRKRVFSKYERPKRSFVP
jgi:hypothetical protein